MVGLGIPYVIKHKGVVGCQSRGKQPAKGKEKVMSGERLAVGPTGILAKLENPFVGLFFVNGIPFVATPGRATPS